MKDRSHLSWVRDAFAKDTQFYEGIDYIQNWQIPPFLTSESRLNKISSQPGQIYPGETSVSISLLIEGTSENGIRKKGNETKMREQVYKIVKHNICFGLFRDRNQDRVA